MWPFKTKEKKYRILSIDGGGMKGVFTAYALWKLEEEYDIKVRDHFDMVVGTSTGALIAAGVLNGTPGKEIFDSYMDPNNPIFKGKRTFRKQFGSIWYAQYETDGIMGYLKEEVGDNTLESLYKISKKKDFAFFATNFTKAKPIIYASPSLKGSSLTETDKSMIDVLRATTSAPFFFEPVINEDDEFILDGGLWANNPSLAGVNLAVADLGKKLKDIEVLSFGQSFTTDLNFKLFSTGEVIKHPLKNQFIQLLLSSLALSQNSQSSMVKNLMGDSMYRYEPEVKQAGVAIDKVDTKFVNYSKVYWTKNKESLVKFIKLGENDKE